MRFEFRTGEASTATYAYDDETGILGVRIGTDDSGSQGTLQLADHGGGIVLLHSSRGVIDGIEIVIWPEIEAGASLSVPPVTETGTVNLPDSVDEMECDVVCRVNSDGSMLRLAVEDGYATSTIRIADKVLVDLDEDNELVGLWLMQLPDGISVAV